MLVNTSNYNEGVQKTMTNITKRSLVAAGVLAALMAGEGGVGRGLNPCRAGS